jgi:hypothetical protein
MDRSELGRLIGEQGEPERGDTAPHVVGLRVIEPGPAARRSELLNEGRLLRTQDIGYFITAPTFETTSEKYARIECELTPASRVFLDEPDLCAESDYSSGLPPSSSSMVSTTGNPILMGRISEPI